ncbi:hypothetical protein L3N51_01496 [Metallosphaera sp. J1]|uniref:helix-turn-helix domain-containing protein n=1 Tax=Metallosphaera javensis (ex Hofmann et al. 2022) TaxID=99938 RepID=UPI001EDF897C|nr:helix-turn-helix domain-containing protein [Metallosphaera javensis (ex Hofmann et al. 2022)]MCG3109206.1 hypothetical protein [Metallosphaera javensis (ex Hofmann et al. 2022)]
MRNNLKEVVIAINHETCWTSLVGNYPVKTLHLNVNNEKDYIRSIIVVDRKHKNLISEIKRTRSFLGYSSLSLDDGDRILFDFRKRYKNSVMDTIQSHDGIVMEGLKFRGREFWRLLIYESYIHELVEALKSKGNLEIISTGDLQVEEDDLSPKELQILITAYKNGYFDFPKRIKSDSISKLFGMSKSTFTYHLRSAEQSLIRRYLRDLTFQNMVNAVSRDEESNKGRGSF